MPTYAYRCPSCGHQFEKFHKITVTEPPSCPECGAKPERVITGGAGLLFKGSGFYITDYKKSGAKDGESATRPDKDAGAKAKTGKAEEKTSTPKPKKTGD